jgi:hypothetical protein
LLGGLTGALIGAVIRGAFTFLNLQDAGLFGLLSSLPSAGIGFLCGAIAGCFCHVWKGIFLGAFLSAGMFGLFVLPFAFLFHIFDAVEKVGEFTWLYFVQKAIAGAIAGGLGGFVGRSIFLSEHQETSSSNSMTAKK